MVFTKLVMAGLLHNLVTFSVVNVFKMIFKWKGWICRFQNPFSLHTRWSHALNSYFCIWAIAASHTHQMYQYTIAITFNLNKFHQRASCTMAKQLSNQLHTIVVMLFSLFNENSQWTFDVWCLQTPSCPSSLNSPASGSSDICGLPGISTGECISLGCCVLNGQCVLPIASGMCTSNLIILS